MNLAIIGSRWITAYYFIDYKIKEIFDVKKIGTIISGGASGVDSEAKKFANTNKIKFTEFLPDYKKYPHNATHKRNEKIVEYSDKILAIWDGSSRGTLSTINFAEKHNKPFYVIHYNPEKYIIQENSCKYLLEVIEDVIVNASFTGKKWIGKPIEQVFKIKNITYTKY